MRDVRKEWVGKSDNTWPPPQRVQLRLFEAARGMCQLCNVKLKPGTWEIDHKIRVRDGEGNNRERNLQIICKACHKEKTAKENSDQAKADRVKAKTYGIKRKSKFPNSRDGKFKTKINGETVLR